MFNSNNTEILQLEISNHCNAACPQCPRNYFGGAVIPTLPLQRWSLSTFKKIFTHRWVSQIREVYFCGTYGDPMTNRDILSMTRFLRNNNKSIKIGIHTNGGVGTENTYRELAPLVDFIAFGIDGLDDTNHIYRRHVKWSKIMHNVSTFVSAGGRAIWDFIVFRHNEHQVQEARDLSNRLGVAEFNIKKTSRFVNRNHKYSDSLDVQDRQGFVDYQIAIPLQPMYVNEGYNLFRNGEIDVQCTKISCNSLRIKEIYIGADGFVFPCGWLHDRLYGPEVDGSEDQQKIKKMMAEAGGIAAINVFHTPLTEIVDGKWFEIIQRSWGQPSQLSRCGVMCGNTVNLIGPQNAEVKYKT